jgi:DNA polymerase-3 subunit chi
MTHVDFYVLADHNHMTRLHYACQLAEKAINQGLHTVIHLDEANQADQLSDYLWLFKPESFLPHHLESDQDDCSSIVLSWSEDKDHYHELMINLGKQIPEYFSRFQRVNEIVVQNEECLKITRNHYQFYRDRGYPLKSHQIANK